LRDAGFGLPALRSLLGRGVDVLVDLVRAPPPGLRGSAQERSADALPVVLLYQPGADRADVVSTLEAVPDLQSSAGVRVVLVLDRPHLAVARRAGLVVELLPGSDSWARRHPDRPWPEEVGRRLALMRRDYAAAAVIELPRESLGVSERATIAARMASAAHVGRTMPIWRRIRAAFVRLIDPPIRSRSRLLTWS
jgi:hypothetical protein